MSNESPITNSQDYQQFLIELKDRIRTAQVKAGLAVNRELVMLYWQIGGDIWKRQKEQGWGAKVINRLSRDLRQTFPEMKGFSPRNLQYMRTFAEAYPNEQFALAGPARITWYHNCTLLDKVRDAQEREWYIKKIIEQGWSRDILVLQIDSKLYQRQGQAATNFPLTLPALQSDLAQQMLKDPYNFDFLGLGDKAHERDVHRGLVEHIREFLIELGAGFAFLGSNYHLEVEGKDYYLDLLFYHVKLHRYIVIDLKATGFEPEYVGKMNFYLSAVDDNVKDPEDNPSIGLILCKSKNKVEAEYALRGVKTPIGIAGYALELTKALPENLKGNLPSIEELEAELESSVEEQGEAEA